MNKKEVKKITISPIMLVVLVIVVAGVISLGTSYAANVYLYDSKDVKYDNSESGIVATDVQGAVDELYAAATDYSSINTRLTTIENSFLNKTYPIDSIYISVNNTNPGTILGGTWISFGEGRTLIGIGNNGTTNYNSVESLGGTESELYTPVGSNTGGSVGAHALTVNELPKFTPAFDFKITRSGWGYSTGSSYSEGVYTAGNGTNLNIKQIGGGQSHSHGFTNPTFIGTQATISHMQPYITVYMWKRTA